MRYLLITYYRKANGKIDEVMTVSNKIRPKDHQMTNIILDFKDQVVLKCIMDGEQVPKDWDKIVSYFYQYYQATIERLFTENGHKIEMEESQPADPS